MGERFGETGVASVMMTSEHNAPGGPGIAPRWTSSAKSGVGTAVARNSRVWFTLSHGIFNEIYYGRIDQACTRDMGLIVTDGEEFFSEEKRDTDSNVEWLVDGVPGFRLINTCRRGDYRIEKEIVTDPVRNTVLQQTRFIPQKGELAGYHLYVLLAPHLGNQGFGNTAWVGEFDDKPVLIELRHAGGLANGFRQYGLADTTGPSEGSLEFKFLDEPFITSLNESKRSSRSTRVHRHGHIRRCSVIL